MPRRVFPGLVDKAANGGFVTITRPGKAATVLVSVDAAEAARKMLARPQPNFGDFLMAYPGKDEAKRVEAQLRHADL
ncbi:hypothetical protein SAMN04487976_11083 [Xaviernesmea oryzae]|nr:hypothetical protein SAMN04487976_11083 [Xaviernesmea oryzae]